MICDFVKIDLIANGHAMLICVKPFMIRQNILSDTTQFTPPPATHPE